MVGVNEEMHASAAVDDSMSGTTAVAALVAAGAFHVANVGDSRRGWGPALHVANVGDSRAVAGVWRDGRVDAEELSWDQTPFRADERARVRPAARGSCPSSRWRACATPTPRAGSPTRGTSLASGPTTYGLYPGTAFTRSLGDLAAEGAGVIADPEVKTVEITPAHLFFVVASDGVFEFLSSQEVVDMAVQNVRPTSPYLAKQILFCTLTRCLMKIPEGLVYGASIPYVRMGNSKSKAIEHPPGENLSTGLTSGTNVEEYNGSGLSVTENVDDRHTTLADGTSLLRVGDQLDSRLSARSNLSLDCGRYVAEDSYGTDIVDARSNLSLDCGRYVAEDSYVVGYQPSNDGVRSSCNNKKDGTTMVQDGTQYERTCVQHETGPGSNEHKNYNDEKREQFNAQRRGAYRKKKEEDPCMLQDENQTAISNSHEPTSGQHASGAACNERKNYHDDKRQQFNAQRHAAYRKKKEEESVIPIEENLPPRTMRNKTELVTARGRASYRSTKTDGTRKEQGDGQIVHRRTLCDITNVHRPSNVISDNPTSSGYTSLSHNDAAFHPASTVTNSAILDKVIHSN